MEIQSHAEFLWTTDNKEIFWFRRGRSDRKAPEPWDICIFTAAFAGSTKGNIVYMNQPDTCAMYSKCILYKRIDGQSQSFWILWYCFVL